MSTDNKEVLYIKLIGGEELVGYAVDGEAATQLTNPLIIFTELNEGKVQSSFFPYMTHKGSDNVVIMMNAIQSVTTPSEELAKQYKKYIGEVVIETPSKEIILPK